MITSAANSYASADVGSRVESFFAFAFAPTEVNLAPGDMQNFFTSRANSVALGTNPLSEGFSWMNWLA